MPPSFLQLRGNSRPTSSQKNEINGLAHTKPIAICLFQRGTRKNGVYFRVDTKADSRFLLFTSHSSLFARSHFFLFNF